MIYLIPDNRITLTDESLTRNSKSRFKGFFMCDGPKIYKISEDRRTDDNGNTSMKRDVEGSVNNLPQASVR